MKPGLRMSFTTPGGLPVTNAFWVLSSVNFYPIVNRAEIAMLAYSSLAAADSGLPPIGSRTYNIDGATYASLFETKLAAIFSTGLPNRTVEEVLTRAVYRYLRSLKDVVVTPAVIDAQGTVTTPAVMAGFFDPATDA